MQRRRVHAERSVLARGRRLERAREQRPHVRWRGASKVSSLDGAIDCVADVLDPRRRERRHGLVADDGRDPLRPLERHYASMLAAACLRREVARMPLVDGLTLRLAGLRVALALRGVDGPALVLKRLGRLDERSRLILGRATRAVEPRRLSSVRERDATLEGCAQPGGLEECAARPFHRARRVRVAMRDSTSSGVSVSRVCCVGSWTSGTSARTRERRA